MLHHSGLVQEPAHGRVQSPAHCEAGCTTWNIGEGRDTSGAARLDAPEMQAQRIVGAEFCHKCDAVWSTVACVARSCGAGTIFIVMSASVGSNFELLRATDQVAFLEGLPHD